MRLRQIALVAHDLAAAGADIEAVLGLGSPFADSGVHKYGLHNAVWPVGDTFLEVVSPTQPGTTAGRLLDKRSGDGGYMAIFQADDLAAARARIAGAGVRVVDQIDGDGFAFTHLHPRDTGGCIVSVDAMEPPDRWQWAGPDWRAQVRTGLVSAIVGATLQGADPEGMARRWAEVLGRSAELDGDAWRLSLQGGALRFVEPADGRGEGLAAFQVASPAPDEVRRRAAERGLLGPAGEVTLCGTRVDLQPA